MLNEKIHKFTLAIVEPSNIVYEGLIRMLEKTSWQVRIVRIEDFFDLEVQYLTKNFSIVIMNPLYVVNNLNDYLEFKEKYPEIKWLGIIYGIFDSQLLNQFDEHINIYDTYDHIENKIKYLLEKLHPKTGIGLHALSKREKEVLILIAKGKSNKEIADILNLSINTVITHRKNIIQKTGIKTVAGLTIFAYSQGYLKN